MRLQLILCLLLFGTVALPAQTNMVTEVDKAMSFGTRPGFSVSFPNTDQRLVEDVWADFVKTNFGSKLKRGKKGEKSATNCRSASVSAGDFTLYSIVEKIGDGAQLNVWFDQGPHFLSRVDDPTRTNDTKILLTRFYFDVRRAAVGQEVKVEEDKLKEIEKRMDRLQRDIESYKAKLKQAEEDLVQNQKDQESAILDIQKQRLAVEQARQRQGNVENERN